MLVLLAREAVVVVLGLVLLAMGRDIPPSSRLGKVATFGLMTALCVLLGAAVVGGSPTTPDPVLAGLGWVTYWVNVGLIYAATAGYALAARPRRAGPLADARG
jgi:phosphatidylglycerophosphate synthase